MKRIREMFCRCIARLMLPVNSKGTLLVLLWNTVMFIYLDFTADYVSKEHLFDAVSSHMNISTRTLNVALLTYVVIGLVADICVGRSSCFTKLYLSKTMSSNIMTASCTIVIKSMHMPPRARHAKSHGDLLRLQRFVEICRDL